ncbi:uncharacterized protein LOC131685910 [Topomyia yanbarensis]|uniref:uncharacterized protein LOC131685910 n=1 Tax=Topomyia yanbarensis TaxID=2498891 RepID=UPI00273B154F|nr:uncharacterized protein LOC131685910 [Topomyia yanbarensis]
MKFVIAALCLVVLAVTIEANPVPVGWPVSSTVWPAYGGLYGKTVLASPGVWGGWSWPSYGKSWGYGSPLVAGSGLWNYGGYGNGWW